MKSSLTQGIALLAKIKKISALTPNSLIPILVAVLLDQLSKLLVYNFLRTGTLNLIGGILKLQMVLNTRGIFGVSFGNELFYILFPIIGIIVLLYLLSVARNQLETVVVGLIIGGAFGNLIDRFRMNAVIDFIDMGIGKTRWPTYNLADAFITVGIIILLFYGVGRKKGN